MASKISDARQATLNRMQECGVESRVDVSKLVERTQYDDKAREYSIGGIVIARFISNDKGEWVGAFSQLGVTNANGNNVETKGYGTEKPGPWDSRSDHLFIALGRQLASAADLMHSSEKSSDSVASLQAKLSEERRRTAYLDASEIAEGDAEGTVTLELWDLIAPKLQRKFAALYEEHVPEGAKYSDTGEPVNPDEDDDEQPDDEGDDEQPDE